MVSAARAQADDKAILALNRVSTNLMQVARSLNRGSLRDDVHEVIADVKAAVGLEVACPLHLRSSASHTIRLPAQGPDRLVNFLTTAPPLFGTRHVAFHPLKT